ncbi:tRNA N(3)-methylcytidine methyltransferase METTL6 [Episyrphus balteatus]|uniref:tRNA N(3)-methylcytidine methyltransferase METTL6 n=1 Tax=Episyrphus balteatus TaxID=286459 RepID=UPI002485EBD1|nr:tRNA N(3)-methylcytidine methyltransferase METTL6 [Episyrphus balteatus]
MEQLPDNLIAETFTKHEKCLTDEEKQQLITQNNRLVPEFKANQLELNAQRNWDLFYKRNETRFFKDRRWTTREFEELLSESGNTQKTLFEVGCGVGNLIFPLIEENHNNYFYYACDFSPRAVEFVKSNPFYDSTKMKAFQCDITTDVVFEHIPEGSLDIVTMIFVLSAIHPDKFLKVVQNLWRLLKPGGVILFRDYGLYDMAQLRFKPGHKIGENLYMRQDGTRSYYFAERELSDLFSNHGFEVVNNSYVHRRTINPKENIDVPRIFIQGKFKKLATTD